MGRDSIHPECEVKSPFIIMKWRDAGKVIRIDVELKSTDGMQSIFLTVRAEGRKTWASIFTPDHPRYMIEGFTPAHYKNRFRFKILSVEGNDELALNIAYARALEYFERYVRALSGEKKEEMK